MFKTQVIDFLQKLKLDQNKKEEQKKFIQTACRYVMKEAGAADYRNAARAAGIQLKAALRFKQKYFYTPYLLSKLWRAVYLVLEENDRDRVLARYGVLEEDLDFILNYLTKKDIANIKINLAKHDFGNTEEKNAKIIKDQIKYCFGKANKKLRFLVKYDPSFDLADAGHDLIAEATRTAHLYDWMSNEKKQIAHVKRSVCNGVIKIIQEKQSPKRKKIKEEESGRQVEVPKKWVMVESNRNFSKDIAEVLKAKKIKNRHFRNYIRKYHTNEKAVIKDTDYQMTTLSLNCENEKGVSLDAIIGDKNMTGQERYEEKEFITDVRNRVDNKIASIIDIVTGRYGKEFEDWLLETHLIKANLIEHNYKKMLQYACEYIGVDKATAISDICTEMNIQSKTETKTIETDSGRKFTRSFLKIASYN